MYRSGALLMFSLCRGSLLGCNSSFRLWAKKKPFPSGPTYKKGANFKSWPLCKKVGPYIMSRLTKHRSCEIKLFNHEGGQLKTQFANLERLTRQAQSPLAILSSTLASRFVLHNRTACIDMSQDTVTARLWVRALFSRGL